MNIHEFAETIGVSTATVWRALSGRGRIHPDTREMVLRRMRELGYQPNRAAQALAVGRTQTVSLWMPNLYQSVYAKVVHHVQQHLVSDDYDMIVCDLTYREPGHTHAQRLMQVPADGVIAFDGGPRLRQILEQIPHFSLPLVCMGSHCLPSTDRVEVDFGEGAREAVDHLLGLGRRRIACMIGDARLSDATDPRRDAYSAAMRKADLAPEFVAVPPPWTRIEAKRVIAEYIERHGHPGALFCRNDEFAIGAQRALRRMGLRIPSDVALAGCDGIRHTEYTDPPLTTVVQPLDEVCAAAWAFLKRRMQDPSLPLQRTVFRPSLVVRESSSV